MTLSARLREHASTHPQCIALTGADRQISYADLLRHVADAVDWLRDSGVQVVACTLENGPAWAILDIAAMELGICLVPLPPFFSPAQLRHVIAQCGAQAVVVDAPEAIRQQLGRLLADGSRDRAIADQRVAWIETIQAPEAYGRRQTLQGIDKVTFTSGTTGEPKGVMLTWAQVRPVVTSLVEAAGIVRDDQHLALMPLAVLLENVAGLYAGLWAGACVDLRPMRQVGMRGSSGLDARQMVRMLSDLQATTAIFTPQILQGVVEMIERGIDCPPALRFCAVGGAAVSPRLLQRAAEVGLPVFEGYGLSECASVVCLNTPVHARRGSVGRALPHVRLRIADDGEVVVCDRSFEGYLGQPALTESEWHTGDLGTIDVDGFLHLSGRKRNVFITAFGRNVAPEWVERELTLEPLIRQAAVFGEGRPFNVAVIVAADDSSALAIDAALARANRDLPDYARVTAWLRADDAFTVKNGLLTGTGRVRRDAVLARYERHIESIHCEAQIS